MNIYAGNLSYDTGDTELKEAFSAFGTVDSASVIIDRDSNRSKGFGFVEMANNEDGKLAISKLDGTDLQGRTIKVNEAKPREDRSQRW